MNSQAYNSEDLEQTMKLMSYQFEILKFSEREFF